MGIDPIKLAIEHQKSIVDKRTKIQADAGCIRQLLVGRTVSRKDVEADFTVTGVRMNLSGVIEVRGRIKGRGRTRHIGTVYEIELSHG